HVFIAQLLLNAWNKGEDLDLAQLIARIQVPPIRTVGAFDVETFYPEKDRLKLALALNNLLASPSFATWIEGDPLDFSVLMKGPSPPALRGRGQGEGDSGRAKRPSPPPSPPPQPRRGG